jgi:outer membrane receptor protein involved in Fe transport
MSYFLQDEWTLSPQTRLFYGGRYETPKDRDNAFVYAIGLERDLPHDAHFYARVGTGVENPTRSQLENDPTLLDQTSENYDVGLERVFSPRLMGRLGWFRGAIANDFIDYLRPGGDPTNRRDYRTAQTDRTVSGWELDFQGGRRKLSWFANWSHITQDVSETPTIGDQPIQVAVPPRNQVSLGVRCSPADRTKLAVSYTNVADYLARARYFTGGWPIEGYQLTNVTLSHELPKGWRLTAKMSNLFDEEYETQPGFPRPGRNWSVGLSCTVPVPQPSQ